MLEVNDTKVCHLVYYGSRIRSLWGWNKEALFVCTVWSSCSRIMRGKSIVVFKDNEGAKSLAENSLGSAHSKHIEVRHHFMGGLVR